VQVFRLSGTIPANRSVAARSARRADD